MRKKERNIGLIQLIVMIIISSQMFAQVRELDLNQAIEISLKNNNDIILAIMDIKKAKSAINEAYGYAMPSIGLSANYSYFIEKPKMAFPDFISLLSNSTYDVLFRENVIPRDDSKFLPMRTILQSFVQSNNFEVKAELYQILFNSTILEGIGASKIYYELSEEALRANIINTIAKVNKTFNGVVLTKSLLKVLEESLANAELNLNNVRSYYNQGLASEYELIQVEVQVENLKPAILETKNFLNQAEDGLKLLLGLKPQENIQFIGELIYNEINLPAEDILFSNALQNNYDLKTMEKKKQIDKAFIQLGVSEYWPTLTAFANYSLAGSSEDFKFQTYRSSIVGLNLSINLFQGERTKRKVEQYTISYEQTKEQYEKLKDFITMQIRNQIIEIERIKTTINAQQKNVEKAQKLYDISLARFNQGTGTQLEIKNSDIELRLAKTNLLKSIFEHLNAKVELERLLGIIDDKYLHKVFKEISN